MHLYETDVIHVLKGSSTLVIGGHLTDPTSMTMPYATAAVMQPLVRWLLEQLREPTLLFRITALRPARGATTQRTGPVLTGGA